MYPRRPPVIPPDKIAPVRVVRTQAEKNTVMRLRQKALLIGTLIVKGVTPLTSTYMGSIYELFLDSDTLTLQEMATGLDLTPEALRFHVSRLEDLGYLVRMHHRAWVLGPKLQEL